MKSIATITAFDEPAFTSWVMTAPPFDAVIYYRGFLAADSRNATDVNCATARRALAFEVQQFVWLFQRRLGDGLFDYIAVRRPLTKGDPLELPRRFVFRAVAVNTGDPIPLSDLRAAE